MVSPQLAAYSPVYPAKGMLGGQDLAAIEFNYAPVFTVSSGVWPLVTLSMRDHNQPLVLEELRRQRACIAGGGGNNNCLNIQLLTRANAIPAFWRLSRRLY